MWPCRRVSSAGGELTAIFGSTDSRKKLRVSIAAAAAAAAAAAWLLFQCLLR